jgi:hypothetical protein
VGQAPLWRAQEEQTCTEATNPNKKVDDQKKNKIMVGNERTNPMFFQSANFVESNVKINLIETKCGQELFKKRLEGAGDALIDT